MKRQHEARGNQFREQNRNGEEMVKQKTKEMNLHESIARPWYRTTRYAPRRKASLSFSLSLAIRVLRKMNEIIPDTSKAASNRLADK